MNSLNAKSSSFEIGKALDQLVKSAKGPLDRECVTVLFSALAVSRCDNNADVLACLVHSTAITGQACALLVDEDMPIDRGEIASALLWATRLNDRAIAALESFSGTPANGFLGTGPTAN